MYFLFFLCLYKYESLIFNLKFKKMGTFVFSYLGIILLIHLIVLLLIAKFSENKNIL